MSKEERQCSNYYMSDDYSGDELENMPEEEMVKCPKCGRGIPPDFPEGVQFKCGHCGTVLEAISEYVEPEDDDEDPEWDEDNHPGKICIVPDYAIKPEDLE